MGGSGITVFQAVLMGVFGVFAVAGLLFFAGVGGLGITQENTGPVLIWGTLDDGAFQSVVGLLAEDDPRLQQVVYQRKDSRTYDQELAEAIASGQGPDLFIMRQDAIVRHRDKVAPISYDTVPQRQFQETFIEESELFLAPDGVLGLPIAVDPLVLYWNRNMLSAGGFAQPPQYWDELFDIAEEVTERDSAGNITKSAVAFGEYANVLHAKPVLSTLIMQAGGEITEIDDQGQIRPALSTRASEATQPAQSALRFYTEFANPAKTVYSWNRSLPDSRSAFTSGDLALYIGFASEQPLLENLNPNLNFAVAPLPQIRGAEREVSYGNLYAFAIPLASQNPSGALTVATILAGSVPSEQLAQERGTPSPRRDLLAVQTDGVDAVFRDMAIIASGWFDPNPQETNEVFRDMIESVTSGTRRISEAVDQADREIANILGL